MLMIDKLAVYGERPEDTTLRALYVLERDLE